MEPQTYLVSISTLQDILKAQANQDSRYRMIAGQDMVTVIHYGPAGLLHQVAFPVAYRIEGAPENEGTMILMVATDRSRTWEGFWNPVETSLKQVAESIRA